MKHAFLAGENVESQDSDTPAPITPGSPDPLATVAEALEKFAQEVTSRAVQQEADIRRLANMAQSLRRQIARRLPSAEPISTPITRGPVGETIRIPAERPVQLTNVPSSVEGMMSRTWTQAPPISDAETAAIARRVPQEPPAPVVQPIVRVSWTLGALIDHCREARDYAVLYTVREGDVGVGPAVTINEFRNSRDLCTSGQSALSIGLLRMVHRREGALRIVDQWGTNDRFRVEVSHNGGSIRLTVLS